MQRPECTCVGSPFIVIANRRASSTGGDVAPSAPQTIEAKMAAALAASYPHPLLRLRDLHDVESAQLQTLATAPMAAAPATTEAAIDLKHAWEAHERIHAVPARVRRPLDPIEEAQPQPHRLALEGRRVELLAMHDLRPLQVVVDRFDHREALATAS